MKIGLKIIRLTMIFLSLNSWLMIFYHWFTDPISTKSFDDFVLFHIRDTILKRVIITELTGSSWRFNRFNYINIKTTTAADLKLNR